MQCCVSKETSCASCSHLASSDSWCSTSPEHCASCSMEGIVSSAGLLCALSAPPALSPPSASEGTCRETPNAREQRHECRGWCSAAHMQSHCVKCDCQLCFFCARPNLKLFLPPPPPSPPHPVPPRPPMPPFAPPTVPPSSPPSPPPPEPDHPPPPAPMPPSPPHLPSPPTHPPLPFAPDAWSLLVTRKDGRSGGGGSAIEEASLPIVACIVLLACALGCLRPMVRYLCCSSSSSGGPPTNLSTGGLHPLRCAVGELEARSFLDDQDGSADGSTDGSDEVSPRQAQLD